MGIKKKLKIKKALKKQTDLSLLLTMEWIFISVLQDKSHVQ